MAQINKKINIHFPIIAWRLFSSLAFLPLLFSGFIAFAADITPQEVLSFTNEERQKQNLPLLEENAELNKAAELKALDMLKHNYFSHTSPAGVTPWHWIKESGYDYQLAGENLAINFNSAAEQEKAWMNSKSHRENILNAQYTEVGIAVISGQIKGKNSFVTVQLFGTPNAPTVTENVKNSESMFATVPTVKGVQTQVIQASAVQYVSKAIVFFENTSQKIKAALIQNKEAIIQTAREISLILIVMSLTAPGIIFVAFSFREIAPKSWHTSGV